MPTRLKNTSPGSIISSTEADCRLPEERQQEEKERQHRHDVNDGREDDELLRQLRLRYLRHHCNCTSGRRCCSPSLLLLSSPGAPQNSLVGPRRSQERTL